MTSCATFDAMRSDTREGEIARTCAWGSKTASACVWETVIKRERVREGKGGHTLCVSAHLYSKLVFPLHPYFPSVHLSPYLLPSLPPLFLLSLLSLASLFPFLLFMNGHRRNEHDPNIRGGRDNWMLQTKTMVAWKRGLQMCKAARLPASSSAHSESGLMIHCYWSCVPGAHVKSQVRAGNREREVDWLDSSACVCLCVLVLCIWLCKCMRGDWEFGVKLKDDIAESCENMTVWQNKSGN